MQLKSKLSVKELQVLDILLKRFNEKYSSEINSYLRLVIKVDNQLWSGDFVIYDKLHIYEYYINYSGDLTYNRFTKDYFFMPNLDTKDNINQCSSLDSKFSHLLLDELLKLLKGLNLSDFSLSPILFNPVCLSCNVDIPFLILHESEYEVVSLIEVPKA